MRSETVTPEKPLTGSLDVAGRVASIEPSFAVKGTFFDKLRERLGDRWPALSQELSVAPRLGRYMPFSDYPLTDYIRLIAAVASAHYPTVSLREGFRLTARDDFTLFATTTFGRVVLAAVGDAKSAMLAMSSVYTKMAPGDWSVTVTELDDGTLRVLWENIAGFWEYQLGQTEGLALSYRTKTVITVTEHAPRRVQFDIVLRK